MILVAGVNASWVPTLDSFDVDMPPPEVNAGTGDSVAAVGDGQFVNAGTFFLRKNPKDGAP